jgi:hypothetical protein
LDQIDVQDAVDLAKVEANKTKALFVVKKKTEENSKGTGQPLHALQRLIAY